MNYNLQMYTIYNTHTKKVPPLPPHHLPVWSSDTRW